LHISTRCCAVNLPRASKHYFEKTVLAFREK
jgi:hypothetical protein